MTTHEPTFEDFMALYRQLTPEGQAWARRELVRRVLAVRPGNVDAAPQAPAERPALRLVKTGGRNYAR